MLQVHAHFLARLLPNGRIVTSPMEPVTLGILDAYAFAKDDEARPGRVPHHWDVTSDSLAARAAIVSQARELVLLKSADWEGQDWAAAARADVVDPYFPQVMAQAPGLAVRVINLRTWEPKD